mmetsp:Transcript_13232/g.38620  ORF Transcript_13232/g.38620 Transcript_13232/m.38620 type:complete len:102 (-) Transcript_13232:45-350(-)
MACVMLRRLGCHSSAAAQGVAVCSLGARRFCLPVDCHLSTFSDAQVELLGALLERENGELLGWLSAQAPVPAGLLENEVMQLLLKYVDSNHPALRRCDHPP